uniref:SAM domain-containing protein n=1 Tax=Callorhinchus milii TaxID=7868 RepID=A0A4W3HE67_CALMI
FKQACFKSNRINGRKLIYVTASSLPNMGITDFQHIKVITAAIRKLMTITEPQWCRSISLRHRDSMGLFLERKGPTGKRANTLTLSQFLKELEA